MKDNMSKLERMIYSGRGIIVGTTPKGHQFIGYSLTGRSPSSQARKLVEESTKDCMVIRTEVTDKEQLEKGNPALLLYPAMICTTAEDGLQGDAGKQSENAGNIVMIAGNGIQTELAYSVVKQMGSDLSAVLPEYVLKTAFSRPEFRYNPHGSADDRWIDITSFEPDPPNNTPRISACLYNGHSAMHLVRQNETEQDRTRTGHCGEMEEDFFSRAAVRHYAHMITTYEGGNEKPLKPFRGEPINMWIEHDSAEAIAESIYEAIGGGQDPGDNYRVAAAVMMNKKHTGRIETAIINRCDRGD